ncbi:MAG TPA: hypothetical protein PKB03_07230 [Baekduia sp.]|nr:hypothetical protein [Baekduia sp.]
MRRTGDSGRGRAAATALLIAAVSAGLAPAAEAAKSKTRDVLVVSNNWAGTADIIDTKTYKRLKRLNVVPDKAERVAQIQKDETATFYYNNIRNLVGEGNDQYVDDGFTSPDGRTVYFSRPSFADVVAIDMGSGKIKWRTAVDGYRADHMALSKSGKRLLVSASTANVIDSIDTRTGKITAKIPSGDSPHENNFSRNEKLIYHASIGTVYTDTDDPSEDSTKGKRYFQVIDARTNKVLRQINMTEKLAQAGYPNMSSAVRPMAITPDERYVYFQVSFYFGIVQYDLKTDKVVTLLNLPLGAAKGMPRTKFTLDSAHHGLAMNPQGTKLCVAGTMSNYSAIVTRKPFKLVRTANVGRTPYWSQSSKDGKYCYVSVAGDDRVAVISFATGKEVRRIKVGDHPQRMRLGVIRNDLIKR